MKISIGCEHMFGWFGCKKMSVKSSYAVVCGPEVWSSGMKFVWTVSYQTELQTWIISSMLWKTVFKGEWVIENLQEHVKESIRLDQKHMKRRRL